MATTNKPDETTETAAAPDPVLDTAAQAEVDKINAQGFIGQKVDPRPNSDYSLQSGPDSPGVSDSPTRIDVADLAEDKPAA